MGVVCRCGCGRRSSRSAKKEFGDILANVDVLHGSSESLLTITNVLIVLGMRAGLREREDPPQEASER